MGQFKVIAGDFKPGQGWIKRDHLLMWYPGSKERLPDAKVRFRAIKSVELAAADDITRIGGAISGVALGALLLGPVGAVVGGVLGGRGKEVTFVMNLHNNRVILGTCDPKSYHELLAASLKGRDQ